MCEFGWILLSDGIVLNVNQTYKLSDVKNVIIMGIVKYVL
jgi:hypothetical protein